jgi:chemotaxis protein MotB
MNDLSEDIAQRKVAVRLESRGLVISLGQASFFRSGRAEVDPAAYATIDRLADRIGRMNNPIRLEGHTDNVPIQNPRLSRFKSNWELSAARSIAMLELLVNRNGIARNRLSIAGFADTEPLTTNDDAEGRAHNRRVDVIVMEAASPPLPSN